MAAPTLLSLIDDRNKFENQQPNQKEQIKTQKQQANPDQRSYLNAWF
jgi:hypothetical protein